MYNCNTRMHWQHSTVLTEGSELGMPKLNIVLVEPRIHANAGNIARTCAVTGARLHLVGPYGFSLDDKHLKRAGLDYWHLLDISYYDSLPDSLKRIRMGPFTISPPKHTRSIPTLPIPITVISFSGGKMPAAGGSAPVGL